MQALLEKITIREKSTFKLFIIDDASPDAQTAQKNEAFCTANGIQYFQNKSNLGRSKTRNLFINLTDSDWLLFLDGDCMPAEENFPENYLKAIEQHNFQIIYGGTRYSYEAPANEFLLHWKYGKHAEALPADVRNRKPAESFHSNNFLIKRSLLASNPFSESVTGYGHEDSMLAISLFESGIKIYHIDNPVFHLGLSTNREFMAKTREAIRNLPLVAGLLSDSTLAKHNKLWRTYLKVRPLLPIRLSKPLFLVKGKPFEALFHRGFYNAWLLSWYKLVYLLSLRRM